MIDDETRARAKAYTDSFNEGDDAEPAAEPAAKSEYQALKAKDAEEFSAGFAADEHAADREGAQSSPVKTADVVAKPLAAAAEASSEAAEEAPAQTFKQTFAAQRKAGAATFEWNGKKYSTDVAKAKAAAPVTISKGSKPGLSTTQQMGANYAALKQAQDNMPTATSAAARQALNETVDKSRATFEQAAQAEKAGTSVVKKAVPAAAKPFTVAAPDEIGTTRIDTAPRYFGPGGKVLAGK